MTTTTYRVTLTDGQIFHLRGDMVEASAPVTACFHDPRSAADWQSTPYQTGDCRHHVEEAARLVAVYFADGADDCTDVESVEPLCVDDDA